MKIKMYKIALIGMCILAVLGISLRYGIKYYLAYKNAKSSLEKVESDLRIYSAVVEGQRETIYEARLAMVDTQRKLQLSQDQVERLKETNIRRVEAIGHLELQISSYRDSLVVYKKAERGEVLIEVEDTPDGPMLPLPASFGVSDKWITQGAFIDTLGYGSISFTMEPLSIDLVLGSRGFFNKSYISSVSTNNPHVQVTDNSFQMVDRRPHAWPYLLTTGVGFVLGVVLGGM